MPGAVAAAVCARSEEHTSELQSHSEISYAVFCLKKKKTASEVLKRSGFDLILHKVGATGEGELHLVSFAWDPTLVYFFFIATASTEIYTLSTLFPYTTLFR